MKKNKLSDNPYLTMQETKKELSRYLNSSVLLQSSNFLIYNQKSDEELSYLPFKAEGVRANESHSQDSPKFSFLLPPGTAKTKPSSEKPWEQMESTTSHASMSHALPPAP